MGIEYYNKLLSPYVCIYYQQKDNIIINDIYSLLSRINYNM